MKHVQSRKDTERRSFFRIDDVAILHYKVISEEEPGNGLPQDDQMLIAKLTLKARFDSISRELMPLLRVIEAGSPEVAQYLSSIDRKLNILSEYYTEIAMGDMDMNPQKVNLGAGGLSFYSPSPLMSGSMLQLRMVLLPEDYAVFTYARVVSCTRDSDGATDISPYRISVEFKHMSDDVRDMITRHVLNKEQQSINQKHT